VSWISFYGLNTLILFAVSLLLRTLPLHMDVSNLIGETSIKVLKLSRDMDVSNSIGETSLKLLKPRPL
jgi:hypothetical protein